MAGATFAATRTVRTITEAHKKVIAATAGAVAENSETITRCFYPKMFANNPEVLNFFNPVHQSTLEQPRALANALVAYALAIVNDQLGNLGPAVELMAVKHCALQIQPEQYGIVGSNLMLAIGEVLGDAVTEEVADAWGAAYNQLADILIIREQEIYAEQRAMKGGWNGYRPFIVDRVVDEGSSVKSFYLKPKDGAAFTEHQAGQYLTLHLPANGPGKPCAPRNYSISSAPGESHYRISVKKLDGGVVSSMLHDKIAQGDAVDVAAPLGVFKLPDAFDPAAPLCFVSGGIGLTPLASMAAVNGLKNMRWIHSSRGEMAMRHAVPESAKFTHVDTSKESRLTAAAVHAAADKGSQFYLCGPREFIVSVAGGLKELAGAANVHYEFFGPLAKV